MMEVCDMVRVANQIGDFFKGYGKAEAVNVERPKEAA
jgi:hypothetical protein